MFQDEVHFKITTSVTRKWALKGSKPKVRSPAVSDSIAYSGFIVPDSGCMITNKPTWFTYETVIGSLRNFIDRFPIPPDKKISLIIDNAPWHKKAYRLIVTDKLPEYEDIRNKVEIIKLPPYSPDLNPIEQCWRITRREVTHNRYFHDKQELEEKLDRYFKDHEGPNE